MTTALVKAVQPWLGGQDPGPAERVVYRPMDKKAAGVMMEAETRRAIINLVEKLVTHPMFALIISATTVEHLRKNNVIGQNISIPLQAALFTPTFLKALADATAVGGDIAKLIAMFAAK